jgi:hypothetical protein
LGRATTDHETAARAWREVIALARTENLTANDAGIWNSQSRAACRSRAATTLSSAQRTEKE